jgi:hypothetical protein
MRILVILRGAVLSITPKIHMFDPKSNIRVAGTGVPELLRRVVPIAGINVEDVSTALIAMRFVR